MAARSRSLLRRGAFGLLGLTCLTGLSLPASAQTAEIVPFIVPPSTAAPTTAAPTTVPVTTAPPPVVTAPPITSTPTTVAFPVDTAAPVAEVPATTSKPKAVKKRISAGVVGAGNPNATGAVSIEVSIARQVMTIRRGGQVWKTINVSTGSGRRYCENGRCGNAVTPRGRYRIYGRVSGWRTAALGRLYNPLYFKGGFAIHGSGSVPRYPASHGCVRVSLANARWLPGAIPNGTQVWIH